MIVKINLLWSEIRETNLTHILAERSGRWGRGQLVYIYIYIYMYIYILYYTYLIIIHGGALLFDTDFVLDFEFQTNVS